MNPNELLFCLCFTRFLFTVLCYLCLLCCFCCWLLECWRNTLMNKNWNGCNYLKHFNWPEEVTGPDPWRSRQRRLQLWNKYVVQIILAKLPVYSAAQRNPLRLLWFCRTFPRLLEEKFEEEYLRKSKYMKTGQSDIIKN